MSTVSFISYRNFWSSYHNPYLTSKEAKTHKYKASCSYLHALKITRKFNSDPKTSSRQHGGHTLMSILYLIIQEKTQAVPRDISDSELCPFLRRRWGDQLILVCLGAFWVFTTKLSCPRKALHFKQRGAGDSPTWNADIAGDSAWRPLGTQAVHLPSGGSVAMADAISEI